MNKSKKNVGITVILIVVIAAVGILVSQRIAARSTASEASATETAVVQRGDLSVTVEAAGSLAPHAEVALAFTSGGRVAEVLVVEGQPVEAGQPLVRLETDDLALQVTQAEIALRQAEIQLETLREPPDEADIERAQDTVEQAAAALRLAQINADGAQNSAVVNEALEDAQSTYQEALNDYNYWLNEYDAGDADYWFVDDARQTLDDAQLALDRVQQQSDQIVQSASNDLARAADTYRQAQSDLENLLAGPDERDIEAAQLQVDQSRAALEQARLRLEQATLTAPIAGTVTTLKVQPGEMSSTGQSAVVVSDLTALEAEVNLDETDVSRIQMGMTVLVSVDAFPGQPLTGQVTEIALSANVQSGVVLYPVTVRFDPADLPLRSGMTVNVTFPIEQRTDTLIVPFRAVETEGGQAYVTRVTDSGSEHVAVTLGLITDTQVEISSGLNEGDVVTVFANPVQDTEIMKNPIFGGGQ